jgi:PAS domain S-box-containing protein
MQNLVIANSDPNFLEKASRALVSTGHRFLARCKELDRAIELIRSRQQSDEPVKILLGSVPMNDRQVTDFLRNLREDFPQVAVLVVEEDNSWGMAIDVFAAPTPTWPGNSLMPLDSRALVALVNEAVARFADQKSREVSVDQLWKRLQSSANAADLIDRFLEEVLAILEVESGSIFFFDEKRNRMILVAAANGDGPDLVGLTKNVGEGVAGYVAEHKKPLLVVSREAAPVAVASSPRRYKTESFICAPIVNNGRLIGVLNLTEKKTKTPFNQKDLELVMAIVDQFSASIEQALHHRNLRDKNKKLSAAIKRTTARLRNSKALLSFAEAFNTAVVSNIPLGVVILDENMNVRQANKSFRDLFTERGKDIKGRPFVEALGSVAEEGRKRWEEKILASLQTEQTSSSHFVCAMAEGTSGVFNINTRAFASPENPEEKLVLVIVEDVTNDVMMRARIARSQRLAEMGELVAGVAHEINNPLDGIMRFTNIAVQKANGDEFLEECFSETKKGLERISRIVKSLMQYTRNCRKTFVETNVNDILDNVLVLMSYMQTKRNIRVERQFDLRLPSISARSNLDQVFINLVKNAYESMNDGGTLEITTEFDEKSMFIRFKDTGCGIPPDVLSKLGETFVTTKQSGTGLGLSICQEIIKQHEGELTVESEVGVGSTFTVCLPLQRQEKGNKIGREA